MKEFLAELRKQEEKLLNCVHCGFCLPVCPTYVRLGDEADSPRGRLYLMGAVVDGRLSPDSRAFGFHLDRCLGCRACESVCPSGVEYGHLLEAARGVLANTQPPGILERILARVMGSPSLLGPAMFFTRILRATGFPALVAERLPSSGVLGQVRLGLGMIAATATPQFLEGRREPGRSGGLKDDPPVAVLLGCVQKGLLGRVNRATVRVLEANGYRVVESSGQGCCGAIHAHTGDLDGARRLARKNIEAFEASDPSFIIVNAAGCGAAMKDYPTLLAGDEEFRDRAVALAERVKDVSEILGRDGARIGGALPFTVTYDSPCHLIHGQNIWEEPLRLLDSIPELRLVPLSGHEECCGGAGVYGITHPELGGAIGRDKVDAVLETKARLVATGNPGCMMQIGAGLRMEGQQVDVAHPVELLDESYRRAGFYD